MANSSDDKERLARFTLDHKYGRPVTGHAALSGLDMVLHESASDEESDQDQRNLGLPLRGEVTSADALAGLALVHAERESLDFRERRFIEAYMDRGGTWPAGAEALGYPSGDALRQRYRRLGGTRTWPAGRRAVTADNSVPPSGTEPAAQDRPEVASEAGETEHAPPGAEPAAEPEPAPAESRPSPQGRKKQRPASGRKRRRYTSAELDAYQLDQVRDEDGEITEYRVVVAGDTLGIIARAPYGHRGWIARDTNRTALPHRGGTGRHYARNREEAVIDLLMGIGITTGR